jgi:hypothetical protein
MSEYISEKEIPKDEDWSQIFVTLRFITADPELDLAEIDRLLGLEGRKSVNARGDRVWTHDFLKKFDLQEKELDAIVLTSLIGSLEANAAKIRKIAVRCRAASVWLSFHTWFAQGGFTLPPELAAALGKAGIPIDISVLSFGGVVDENEPEAENEGSCQNDGPEN